MNEEQVKLSPDGENSGLEVLSAAQGRLVEALMQGREAVQCSVERGDDVSTEIVRRISGSAQLQGADDAGESMRILLNRAGLTPAHLANVLREGLACRKHVVIKGVTRKLPDYALRLKYLELAHKLRGDLSAQPQASGQTVTYEERIRRIMHHVDKSVDNSV